MESCRQRSFRVNRPECLELRYPIVASRLIASQIMTEEEHANIKSLYLDNMDRMDELMGFLYKRDSQMAFDAFVVGIRDCRLAGFAAKVKADSEEEGDNQKIQNSENAFSNSINIDDMNNTSDSEPTVVSISTSIFEVEAPSQILFEEIEDISQSLSSSSSSTLPNNIPVTSPGNDTLSQPPILGSSFISCHNQTTENHSRNPMNFQQAITRQKYGRVNFFFSNSPVHAEIVHSNPYAGIAYKGCAAVVGIDSIRTCSRLVSVLSEEDGNATYACEFGHRTNAFIFIPRLKVTFTDDSGALFPITIFKKNVEIFLDMNVFDMTKLDPSELKSKFENAQTKEWNLVEVTCERRRNPRYPWDNIANVISKFGASNVDSPDQCANFGKRTRVEN